MELSIVIVSFDVLYFLRQCIHSVHAACEGLQYEIIVVDNASTDGSVQFLKADQPDNNISICNPSNLGYAKAMNQGIKIAKGEYVLLLNPDTLVGKKALKSSLDYLKGHNQCGAVGVRMVDGNGNFLKESKRGRPSLLTSIYKATGLSKIFDRSRTFAHYHQGHLNEYKNHKIDVLTGAYMLTRKSTLNQINGFDERYFMYAEDIDLSLTIQNLGLYNYYIGEHSIVHFKGESTRKERISNHFYFYNSMLLYVRKYNPNNILYIAFLTFVLSITGSIRWLKEAVINKISPVLRFLIYFSLFFSISKFWAAFHFNDIQHFDYSIHTRLIIGYSFIMTIGLYLIHQRFFRWKAILSSTIFLLVLYGILPEALRTSRAGLSLGCSAILIAEFLRATIIYYLNHKTTNFWNHKPIAILLSSGISNLETFQNLKIKNNFNYLGVIGNNYINHPNYLTDLNQLDEYLENHPVDTIIFDIENFDTDRLVSILSQYGSQYKYLIHTYSTNSLITSPKSTSRGEITLLEVSWKIGTNSNRLAKRTVDLALSLLLLLISPILLIFISNKYVWVKNITDALIGRKTWVGYSKNTSSTRLPKLKPAILETAEKGIKGYDQNLNYAREYSIWKDIQMIYQHFPQLGS